VAAGGVRAPASERADAVRNRRRIIEAASGILDRGGIEALTIEDVARTAGVGIGTVYRRFTDRAGLLTALVSDREAELQEGFLTGPPPLGPGAPPGARIRAFLHALADRVDAQRELLLALDAVARRGRVTPQLVHETHLVGLVREARPDADATYLATALLAAVSPRAIERYRELSGADGYLDALKAGVDALLAGVLAPPPAAPDGADAPDA
jgi:AcrR family transcriptional regulator